jgi:prepilin-type processing-associated H-X9-DG protein
MYRVLGADGKEYGPVTDEVLRQWISEGRVNPQTHVKAEGAADWQTLGALAEFSPAVAAARAAALSPSMPAKTSGMAISSLVLGVLGLCGVTAVAGLILGILALVNINRSGGRLSGRGLAIAGICVSGFMLLFSIPMTAAMLLPALAKAKAQAQAVNCVNNVKQLSLGMMMYANVNSNSYPLADGWCDAIRNQVRVGQVFRCPSDLQSSRSAYAFNTNLSGVSLTSVKKPATTVLVFECDGGWNVSGGRETLVHAPRHAKIVVVGFADGHVESVPTSQLSRLRWTP